MKKTVLFLTLSLFFIAGSAFAQTDLTGTWCVSMSEAYSASGSEPPAQPHDPVLDGSYVEAQYEIVIDSQDDSSPFGILFFGHVNIYDVNNVLTEVTYFSGVLDGKDISMTSWDSVTRGLLKQKGNNPMEIHFINNAFDADNRSSKTSIGVAIKGECPE